jgi:hypothetical protein
MLDYVTLACRSVDKNQRLSLNCPGKFSKGLNETHTDFEDVARIASTMIDYPKNNITQGYYELS